MSTDAMWDRVANNYDGQAGHGLRRPIETRLWRELFGRLFPAERPLTVLDVGTGTGFVALILAELGHDVTGVDFSAGMLAVAREKAARLGHSIQFVQGDVAASSLAELAVPPGGVDAVVSRHVIWALPEPGATIRDWATLTKPGGRVVAVDGIWSTYGAANQLAAFGGQLLQAVATRRWPRRQLGDPRLPLRHIRDPQPARAAFQHAGLSDIHVEPLPEIDHAERASMTVAERLQHHWRRYLISGRTAQARRGGARTR